jgi:hypothetical protein
MKILVISAVLLLPASWAMGGQADPRKPVRDVRSPWDAFGPGAWVEVDWSQTMDDKKKDAVVRWTLKEDRTVATAKMVEGKAVEGERDLNGPQLVKGMVPGDPNLVFAAKDKTDEELVIGETKLACKKETYTHPREAGTKFTLWRSPGAGIPLRAMGMMGPDMAFPGDIVKVEFTSAQDKSQTTVTSTIKSLKEKVKVGDEEMACVVEEWRLAQKGQEGQFELVFTLWLNDKVPGHVVKFEAKGTKDGKPAAAMSQKLLKYHAEPRKGAEKTPENAPEKKPADGAGKGVK